jgi:hypothetical protein
MYKIVWKTQIMVIISHHFTSYGPRRCLDYDLVMVCKFLQLFVVIIPWNDHRFSFRKAGVSLFVQWAII